MPGETFKDTTNGISVRVNDVSANSYNLTINPSAPQPPNDNFANAQTISSTSVNGTTKGATREVGEPDHSTDTDGFSWIGDHSVWYLWTAPSSGSTTIDTCTANIDSILAVYTGSQLNALSRVADNNNACPSGWGSKVTFKATAGTTYYIAVGDAGGLRENTFTLKVADTEAPTVISTIPADGAKGVRRIANVSATFSEPMDQATLNNSTVTLVKDSDGSTVPATVTLSSDGKTVTLDPSAKLATKKKYKVTIKGGSSGVKDKAGNPLTTDKVWSFTTGRR